MRYLVEVLEALVREGDGDGEDGVGGVLVEARLAVPTEEIQGPAPIRTHGTTETYLTYIPPDIPDREGISRCITGASLLAIHRHIQSAEL